MRLEDHPLWPTAIQLKETWEQLRLPEVFESHTVLGMLYHLDPGVMLDVMFSVAGKWHGRVLFMPKEYLWPYFCFNCWVLGFPRPEAVGTQWLNQDMKSFDVETLLDRLEDGDELPLYDPAIAYASVEEHLRQRDAAMKALHECYEWLETFIEDEQTTALKRQVREVLDRPLGDVSVN